MTTLSSFQRFLRTVGAEVLPYTLMNGQPDPAGRACILRHRVDAGLPDVAWWFSDVLQIEGWWRSLAVGWLARDEILRSVANHYRGASAEERESMAAWQSCWPEERISHPWNAAFSSIESSHSPESVVLPKAWRSWTAREYIKSIKEPFSNDMAGDVIAACVADNQKAYETRLVDRCRMA